jgi:hypothetical protein
VEGRSTDDREIELLNTLLPSAVTPSGMEMDVKPELKKVLLFSIVNELGKVADNSAAQLEKQVAPILVTPLGITIEVRVMQASNPLLPITKSPEGRLIDVKDVQLANELA